MGRVRCASAHSTPGPLRRYAAVGVIKVLGETLNGITMRLPEEEELHAYGCDPYRPFIVQWGKTRCCVLCT